MLQETINYIVDIENNVQKVVSIPVPLFESMQGNYFVGQTKTLFVGKDLNCWAGLVNPCDSNVDLYTNVFTISNFSDDYLTVEIWLNTNVPKKVDVSHKVSPTNTSLKPLPKNKVDILFTEYSIKVPQSGVNVYERIVPPNTTLVSEEDGKFIAPPGGNYVIIIKSSNSKLDQVIVAFGWWEKSNC